MKNKCKINQFIYNIYNNSRLRKISFNKYSPHERAMFWLIFIIVITTILKFIFVFGHTDYKNYLSSDMGGYWTRANERFEGNIFSINQWVIWPPFFHILMANLFKINDFFHLTSYNLEIVLGFNIILSAFSIFYLYFITLRFTDNYRISFITAVLYSLTYYTFYFNAFVLSENFAVPIAIASLYYLLLNRKGYILLSGVLLAIATGIRPGYGILGLSFAIYAMVADFNSFPKKQDASKIMKGIIKAALFSFGFFILILLIVAENYHLSQGNLKGLAASSGINKFFSFTKTYEVQSRFDGYYYVIIPPGTVTKPENGKLITNEPIYNTHFFNKMTNDYIKENPRVLFQKIKDLQTLYFGTLFPSVSSVYGYDLLIQPSRWLVFFLSLFVVLSLLTGRLKQGDKKIYWLLIAIIFFSLIVCYIYNTEHRYLYSFLFAIYPLSIQSVYNTFRHFKTIKKLLLAFIAALLIPLAVYKGYELFKKLTIQEKIKVNITDIYNQNTSDSLQVDILNFPFNKELTHANLGNLHKKDAGNLHFEGEFELFEDGFLEFYVYCEEGCELYIDNNLSVGRMYRDDEKELKNIIFMNKGLHNFHLVYFHRNFDIGIKAMFAPLLENDIHKYFFGEDTKSMKFIMNNKN